ncbi:MAG: M3 family oligoendopeptidase [Clostridia bacterium]|nr:M3 family oligoendopeptidase [Clostridia bacterium]
MKFSEMPYHRADIATACAEIAEVTAAVPNAASADALMEMYRRMCEIAKDVLTMQSLCYVRHTIDTRDTFYDEENNYYDEQMPLFSLATMEYYKAMVASPLRAELEARMGSLWFQNAELQLKGMDERIVADMQEDNAVCSAYKKLLASAKIEFDGKILNLSQLRAYQLADDREVRRAAYAKRSEFFAAHAEEFDEFYDKLVKIRTREAKTLGLSNYTELGYIHMMRNSYDRNDVAKLREQVKKVIVPLATRLHEMRRKALGLDSLKYYDEDLFFAEGNPEPHGTPEELFAAGKTMYAELSAETREFFDFMLENELFDAMAKEGKSGGGYCTVLPAYGAPFVFSNFNGTSEDVDTLTHECGHALNFYFGLAQEILEYQESTLDVAEIHSMSMEFFTEDWMHLFFGDDEKRYRFMHMALAITFLPYGCLVDEFQHEVYDHPELTPAERKALWRRLEKEYQPHLDYDGDAFLEGGGLWQRQSHIYERPFYYIDYCIAQVCALQYRIWMESDFDAAWQSYCALSKKAGSARLTELVAEADLVSPFADGCMQKVAEGIAAILEKLA